MPVPAQACSHLDIESENEECYVQCPDEMVFSTWSDWTPCPPACTGKPMARRRMSYRNRTLLALGTNLSPLKLAELSETRSCPSTTSHCDTYHWRAGLWNGCPVHNRTSNCGPGVRRREAICVTYNSAAEVAGRVVPHWRCRGLEPPLLEEACHQSCPLGCQLTQWSDWSSCQDHCSDLTATTSPTLTSTAPSLMVIMNTQSRYRRVLQWPQNGGKSCPRLMDVRPCPLQSGQSCPSRTWRPRGWSACLLPENKSCGDGIQVRGLDCFFSGSRVDKNECLEDTELMSRPLPVQSQSCRVDCQTLCVMGSWSSWTSCTAGCPSRRTRRRVLNHPVECASVPSIETEDCDCQKYR